MRMMYALYNIIIWITIGTMEHSKTFISMRIVDIEKCIWVNNGTMKHYSYHNHRVDIISILGIVSDIEYQDGFIMFKYVYIL